MTRRGVALLLAFVLPKGLLLAASLDPRYGEWVGSDIWLYYATAAKQFAAVVRGENFFERWEFEYPPLAFVLLDLPARISGVVWPTEPMSFPAYAFAFRSLMFGCDAVIFALLASLPGGAGAVWRRALVYQALTLLLAPVLYDRFDLAMTAPLAAALAASLHPQGHRCAPWLLTLATHVKLIPALLAPWILLNTPTEARPANERLAWRDRRRATLVYVGGTLALAGVFWLLWGDGAFRFLGYHANRGLQIESTWATAVAWQRLAAGDSLAIQVQFGAWQLHGADAVASAATPVLLGAVGLLAVSHLRGVSASPQRDDCSRAPLAFSVALLAILLCSKVLSPQFLLWLCPFIAWIAALPRTNLIVALSLACAGLTTLVFPVTYTSWIVAEHVETRGVLTFTGLLLITIRNLLLLALFVVLLRRWRKADSRAHDAE